MEARGERKLGGAFTRCHNKLLSTKRDEAINSLLLFRLPAHSESLFLRVLFNGPHISICLAASSPRPAEA